MLGISDYHYTKAELEIIYVMCEEIQKKRNGRYMARA